jgi:hypothetical protein
MAQVKLLKLNGADIAQSSTSDDVTFATFMVGAGGSLLRDASGVIEVRNNANNAYASLRVGNLFIDGSVTEIEKESIVVESNFITLNVNETGTPSEDAYFEVERGTSANAQLYWNETTDRFQAGVVGSLSNIILANSTDLDSRYYTETEIGTTSGTTGSDLVGDDNSYSNFTPATTTVKGALSGIDSALGSLSSANIKATYTAGVGGIAAFDAVYVSANNTVLKADADDIATSRVIGVAAAAITAAASGYIVTSGLLTGAGSGWTAGSPVYLSTTAGGLTQTAPSGSADCIVEIGIAKNATDLQINIGKPLILA